MPDNSAQVGSGHGGQRKGSTKAQKQKDIANELLCIELIAKEYKRKQCKDCLGWQKCKHHQVFWREWRMRKILDGGCSRNVEMQAGVISNY